MKIKIIAMLFPFTYNDHDLFWCIHELHIILLQLENNYCSAVKVGSEENVVGAQLGGVTEGEAVEQKELDSFERWWDKEIAGDFDDNLITHVTGKYWDTLDTRNEEKEGMSLCLDMLLDTDFLGPSLSQQQLFSINDFAPQWTISGMETKV